MKKALINESSEQIKEKIGAEGVLYKEKIAKVSVVGKISFNEQTVVTFSGLQKGQEITVPGEEISSAIKKFSATLNPKQLEIFKSRLLSEDKIIMADIAKKLEISIERVRQIEKQVKEKFQDFLTENYENITFLQD